MANPAGIDHPRFMEAVRHLHPGDDIRGKVTLLDHGPAPVGKALSEGDGPFGLELIWGLEAPIPTYDEVEASLPLIDREIVLQQRRAAYATGSDQLGLRAIALRLEADPRAEQAESDWLTARKAVKDLFPMPVL